MEEKELKKLFNPRHKRPGDVFMETLQRDGLVVAPGVYDAMGGYIAKKIYEERKAASLPCTFNAIYLGHWSTSCMHLRKPDMGFISLELATDIASHIVPQAYPLPVIFDIETGFGRNSTTITEVAEKCHEIGIAVVHLEDQEDSGTIARRCGNHGGKMCTDVANMIAKIESCLEVFKSLNSSVRLMARTDALTAANGGIENAIERGKRYMSVDVQGWRPTILWADAMYDPRHIDRWVEEFRKWDPNIILGINYSPNRDWTRETYQEKFKQNPPTYADLYRNGDGFSVIWHTILQARAAMEAAWNTFDDMAANGAEALEKLHRRQHNHPVGNAQAMSGAEEWQAYDKHRGGSKADERYRQSEGYEQDDKNN